MGKDINHFGTLYVVATPIGNLEDITLRAARILKEADLIAAEDTRHTKKLLSHLDIHTPLVSYFKDKEKERSARIIEELADGKNVALVSDAGTPCISDPGAILVAEARKRGIEVTPVPGPSALTAALSVAGLEDKSFSFYGFLPASKSQRTKFLAEVAHSSTPFVFYESPKRVLKCLKDCLAVLGDREIFLARELTKIHEEFLSGKISEVLNSLDNRPTVKGEFVVIVSAARVEAKPQDADIDELLQWYKGQGLSLKDAVKRLAADFEMSRSEIYKKALEIWDAD